MSERSDYKAFDKRPTARTFASLMKAKKESDEKKKTDLEKIEKAEVKSEDIFNNSFAD